MDPISVPLSIRFVGPKLKTNGVPISDLGESLIALQRMVHKAYLIDAEQSFIHAAVDRDLRQKLALQIVGRDRQSDSYLLNWLVQEVATSLPVDLLSNLILSIAGAASLYVAKKIKEKLESLKLHDPELGESKVDLLAVRLYNEVQELVNRVDPKGGIEILEIGIAGRRKPVIFNQAVRSYVKSLEGAKVYGAGDTISGRVDKAHTLKRNCIELLDNVDGKWLKVYLPSELFEDLLKDLTNPKLRNFEFTGRAVFRVGRALHTFNEFEAETYRPIPS